MQFSHSDLEGHSAWNKQESLYKNGDFLGASLSKRKTNPFQVLHPSKIVFKSNKTLLVSKLSASHQILALLPEFYCF